MYICILIESMNPDEVSESKEGTDITVGPVPSDGAAADIKDIRPFLKYFNDLVATEVYNDVLFVSDKNENVWWYDGARRERWELASFCESVNTHCMSPFFEEIPTHDSMCYAIVVYE